MGGSESLQHQATSQPLKPIGAPDPGISVQPATAFGALGFEEEEILSDQTSKVQLSLRCEDLAKVSPVFVAVYSKCSNDDHWRELGMSEVCTTSTKSPVFDPSFNVEFRAEVQCLLRFEVYRVRDRYCVQELLCQKFIGTAEAVLVDVMMARSQGNGWLTKELMNPKPKAGQPPGRIAVWAEEETASKYTVSFNMACKGLKSTYFWKQKADAYAIVHRTLTIPNADPDLDDDFLEDEEDPDPGLKCTPIFHTEVQRKSTCPRFKRVELTSSQLCQNKNDQEIIIEFFDWFRVQRHHYMGEAIVTFADLHKAWRTSKPLEVSICFRDGPRYGSSRGLPGGSRGSTKDSLLRYKTSKERTSSKISKSSSKSRTSSKLDRERSNTKDTKESKATSGSDVSTRSEGSTASGVNRICGRVVASLRFEEVGIERRYSFLDYVRGGLELRLLIAVDFTRSNVGPHHPESFHYMNAERPSAYATAIRAVGNVMRSYCSTDKLMAFGFGAKIPPSHTVCSDCFSLSGDFFDPELDGVDGVQRAYQRALHVVRLHGPTRLAEVVRLGADLSRPFAQANSRNDNGVDMHYYVLLILTDGGIDDQMETISEVAKAADLPLSIVVVGIGDEDFSFLEDLKSEVSTYRRMHPDASPPAPAKQEPEVDPATGAPKPAQQNEVLRGPKRNIVQFVPYKDFRDRPSELAAAALSELPREVVGYYTSKSVKPRGLDAMEDASGNPVPKWLPQPGMRSKTGSKLPQNGSKLPAGGSKALVPATSAVGPAGGRERSISQLSAGGAAAAAEGTSPPPSRKEEERMKLELLPQFVQDERARLMKEALSLGYESNLIKRAFRDGVASNTLAVLVDNIVHAGYGKLPAYKEAAETAIPEMEVNLPGQPSYWLDRSPDNTLPGSFTASMPVGHVAVRPTEGSAPAFGSSLSERIDPAIRKEVARRKISNSSVARAASQEMISRGLSQKRDSYSSYSAQGVSSYSSSTEFKVRQRNSDSTRAIEDKNRRSSSRSILVQNREGVGESKRPTKELNISFNLEHPGGAEGSDTGTRPPSQQQVRKAGTQGAVGAAPSLRSSGQADASDAPRRAIMDASGPGAPASGDELGVCGICLENPVNTELQPCSHRVACDSCAAKLGVTCPLCQAVVREVKRLR